MNSPRPDPDERHHLRVLLVNPSQFHAYGMRVGVPYPPLGLLQIAARLEALRPSVEVDFCDLDLQGWPALREKLSGGSPNLVGLTATTPTFSSALEVAELATELAPQALRVIGGPEATAEPEHVLSTPAFDVAIVGEGEETVVALAERLRQGKGDCSGIPGLWCRRDGRLVRNPRRPLIKDLDGLPWPARHLLPSLGAYQPPDALHQPVATIMASRGCSGRCTFCCSPASFGRRVRYRSVANVVAEIGHLVRDHGVREIHFADDSLTEDRQWVLELCATLRSAALPVHYMFMNGLRVDQVDGELLSALRSIRMQSIGFGIESASPRVLERMRKGIDPREALSTIQLAKEMGFTTWCFFIFGAPGETEESAKETLDFALKADPDFAKFFIFKPFPGTPAYNELVEHGLIDGYERDSTGVYASPVHRLEEMSAERMRYWQRHANRSFYLRPSKILGHARRIRSATQLGYNLRSLRFMLGMMLRSV